MKCPMYSLRSFDFRFASIPVTFDGICVHSSSFIKESTVMYNDNKLATCDKLHRMIYSLVTNYTPGRLATLLYGHSILPSQEQHEQQLWATR